jgi:ABC-type multidrug transport system fused ATPase/permease subunit
MDRSAFIRARQFLSYHPVAKWSALAAAGATAVLYVGLLLVLALFADLMVNRGEIPCYANLPQREKKYFLSLLDERAPGKERAVQQALTLFGVDEAHQERLAAGSPEQRAELSREALWMAELVPMLEDAVGSDAADEVRTRIQDSVRKWGPELAFNHNLEDFGILSLVVRSRSSLQGNLVAPVARWNGWMWMQGNRAYLLGLFLLAIVLAALRAGLMYVCGFMAARATIEATTRLRRAVYHHTYRLGTLAFRALGPSEAVGVSTRHVEAVHDGLYAWLTVVFREPVKFVLLLLFALLVNFWLSLAFLLFAFLVWLIGGQAAAYFRRQGRLAEHRSAEQLAFLQESLMLMRLVKVYLMEMFNQARVERQLASYAQSQLRRFRGEAIYRPLLAFLGVLAALVLLLVAGLVVLDGQLGVASAMVLVTALVSLYWPLTTWLDNRRFLRRGRQSAAVVFGFLDRTGGVGQDVEAEFLPALSQSLEFDNVSLKEPGTGRKLLQGVSFTIQAGQRVALVGPEDMEKHALVYLLPRFLDPSAGEIRIDRRSLKWVTLDSLRAQIAIVLQHNLVFNDTVANNIGCGDPTYTLPRIIEAAKIAHAHQFIQKLPEGYETPIGEMGESLRIGEKFRIALARAILRDPALLIIEEPVLPLDDDTKTLLDDTFARILPRRTTIFLPHRLSTIRHCDRVLLLYRGRIEAEGEHRELLAQSELYRHLQYLEFNEFAGLFTGPAVVTSELGEL